MEITTVADDLIVAHDGTTVVRRDGLRPATTYDVAGQSVTTLARPGGELLCRFGTVNDVHFGEVEAGRLDDSPLGPIVRAAAGEAPYPETMNHAAVDEMRAAGLAAVIVKGDLSRDGEPKEWAAFEACYRTAFGDQLHVVRGNHDSHYRQHEYAGDQWITLPGMAVALLDTVRPGEAGGRILPEQLDWLDARAAASTTPVFVMGHHQQSIGGQREGAHFGLDPDSSDGLDDVAVRRPSIVAYAAGHTHRHRLRHMARSAVPSIEIGCVKDFPGTWAEYRVHEGGMLQVVHRMSSPAALDWSERCRHLYADYGLDYTEYALGALADRCFAVEWRA
ncbi:MAG: metallophosphoesterase [Ilumatobacteraceae bacterium]